jgi:hypothetical protein
MEAVCLRETIHTYQTSKTIHPRCVLDKKTQIRFSLKQFLYSVLPEEQVDHHHVSKNVRL